jgi:predicted dehydrogenase
MPHLALPDVQDRVRLQAVCDPVSGRAEAAAERFGGPSGGRAIVHAFERYEDLLDKGEVDAVSIASPIGLHYQQGRQALDAGKHVHFNKTMTTTVEEATDLIETAKRKGLKIVASPGEMLRPHNQHIKQMIQNGDLGTLAWAACGAAFGTYHEREGVRQGDDVLSNIDPSWYFRKPGGGPLYDMTVYAMHTLTGILGPAKRITAMSGTRIKEREFRGTMVPTDADDNTLMALDFGDALFAFVYGTAAGRVTEGFAPSFFGTKGSIVGITFNGEPIKYPGSELVEQTAPVARGERGSQGQRPNRSWLLPHVVGAHREIGEQHVYEDVMQLVDYIREDKPTIVTPEHARHVIDLIESAYRAAETGQTQDLRTAF